MLEALTTIPEELRTLWSWADGGEHVGELWNTGAKDEPGCSRPATQAELTRLSEPPRGP